MKLKKNTTITAPMEDYLEAIAMLAEKSEKVRVCDIGRFLNVKNPSVTAALAVLSEQGLVHHERYGAVELTARGKRIAEAVKRRHELLTIFLIRILHVDKKIAVQDACKIEHVMSAHTTDQLMKFIAFVEQSSEGKKPAWLEPCDTYLSQEKLYV